MVAIAYTLWPIILFQGSVKIELLAEIHVVKHIDVTAFALGTKTLM